MIVFNKHAFLMTYLKLHIRSLSLLGLTGPISLRSPLNFPLSLKLPAPFPKDDPEPDDSQVPQPRPNEFASFEASWGDGMATGLPLLAGSVLEELDWSYPEPLEPLCECTELVSPVCMRLNVSTNRGILSLVGGSFFAIRGGDCRDVLPDRLLRMSKAPGVRG